MFIRSVSLFAGALLLCAASAIATAAEQGPRAAGKDPGAAARDPRSGAAINRDAALRFRAGKSGAASATSPLRIHHSAVNNPGADATAQDTQSETTITDLGGGNLVAAWNDSGSFLGGASHFTGYAWSNNNGLSWTDPGALPNSAEGDAGDPVLAGRPGGPVYLATLGFTTGENIQVFRSNDFGHTFGAPTNGTPGYAGSGDFQDKEWMAIDKFPGFGNGVLYLCWTRFGSATDIRFTRSTNGAVSFTPNLGVLISSGGQGCFIVVSPNHQVNVFYYRGTGAGGQGGDNKLFVRRSTDLGVTFSPEVQVADLNTTTVNGNLGLNGGLRSNSFAHAAVNPVAARPYLYVVYNDDPAPGTADNGDIYLVFSTDNGATWSAPVKVNDDLARDQFFPTIGFANAGERPMISYYSRSQDPSNFVFHRRARLGVLTAGGAISFPQSFQLSPNTPIVVGQDPVINATYMGDYDQIAGGAGALSAIWSDNRAGNAFHARQPDVRFARIAAPPASSDLGVSISASPANVPLGQNTVVTVTATATGGAATDVFVNVPQPFGLFIQSINSAAGPCTLISGFVGCSLGTVTPGSPKSIQIVVFAGYNVNTRIVTATATTSSNDGAGANNSASVNVVVSPSATATMGHTTGNVAIAIPDAAGGVPGTVEIPLLVPVEGTAVQLIPRVRLNHTFDADLDIFLISPLGKTVELSSDNGGAGDNYGSGANSCAGTPTTFNDLAVPSIIGAAAPFAGVFQPEQQLGNLFGDPVDGVWKLRISDDAATDTGTVFCFSMDIVRNP